jgi:hypothetical protein
MICDWGCIFGWCCYLCCVDTLSQIWCYISCARHSCAGFPLPCDKCDWPSTVFIYGFRFCIMKSFYCLCCVTHICVQNVWFMWQLTPNRTVNLYFMVGATQFSICTCHAWRWSSSVCIMTRLRVGRSGVPIPVRVRHFSLLQTSRPALGPTQPPISRISGFFPGGKTVEAWNEPLTSKVPRLRMSGVIPPLGLYGVETEIFTFIPKDWGKIKYML